MLMKIIVLPFFTFDPFRKEKHLISIMSQTFGHPLPCVAYKSPRFACLMYLTRSSPKDKF